MHDLAVIRAEIKRTSARIARLTEQLEQTNETRRFYVRSLEMEEKELRRLTEFVAQHGVKDQ